MLRQVEITEDDLHAVDWVCTGTFIERYRIAFDENGLKFFVSYDAKQVPTLLFAEAEDIPSLIEKIKRTQ